VEAASQLTTDSNVYVCKDTKGMLVKHLNIAHLRLVLMVELVKKYSMAIAAFVKVDLEDKIAKLKTIAGPLTRVNTEVYALNWTMVINADVKLDIRVSTAKKRNIAFLIHARMVDPAAQRKKDSHAYASLASEERYVRFRTCVPQIHACMTEHVLTWITTHSNASVGRAGKDKTAKRRTCAFPVRVKTKDIVKHMDLHSSVTVPSATKENTVKLRIPVAQTRAIIVVIVSLMARTTLNVNALEASQE